MRSREEWFTTLQSSHLLFHYKANNGQAGVGFLTNKKCKDHIVRVSSFSPRVAELVMCITKRYNVKIVQIYAATTYSEEDIYSLYNDDDETLGKPNHYTIVIGDFNAQIGKNNKPFGNGNGQMWARNEKHQESTKKNIVICQFTNIRQTVINIS